MVKKILNFLMVQLEKKKNCSKRSIAHDVFSGSRSLEAVNLKVNGKF